jgi:hypothetical protein
MPLPKRIHTIQDRSLVENIDNLIGREIHK